MPDSTDPATCPLELVRVEKVPGESYRAFGAWTPSADHAWVAWSDHRHATTSGALPYAFARPLKNTTGDLSLGESSGHTAIVDLGEHALAATPGRDRKLGVFELDRFEAREIARLGDQAGLPLLARSEDLVAAAWVETLDFPRLTIATRRADGAFSAPLTLSQPPYAMRARMVGVPDGFVLAWTQLPHEVWFARVIVDEANVPRIAWRIHFDEPGAGEWPTITNDEPGEITLVDDELHLPLLKASCGACLADTHVLRIALDGTILPTAKLRETPYFAATVSRHGLTTAVLDEVTRGVCIYRHTLDGARLAPPSCASSESVPMVPSSSDGYAVLTYEHSTLWWVGDELHVATLDNHTGSVFGMHRVFACARASRRVAL